MKMPDKIEITMLAPCGINCMACYKHVDSLKRGKPCPGCSAADQGKPEHCFKCRIKACAVEKGHTYCFECAEFPCKLNKKLDRSYEKYHWSLIMNGQDAKENSVEWFLDSQRKYWTCSKCGGVISLHDAVCSDCGAKLADMRLGPYAHFGIIDDIDIYKDYSLFSEGMSFQDCLSKYRCIAIPDDIINDWWAGFTVIKTYFHCLSRPETALARWGVTIIPPESLDAFADIVKNQTGERFSALCRSEIDLLLALIEQAKQENKHVIHYGV